MAMNAGLGPEGLPEPKPESGRQRAPRPRHEPGGARGLRVCALYPDLMNIYADRGNLLVLERRCRWRGIPFELSASGIGEPLDGRAHDIYYIGGGQDRDQRLCAADLIENKRAALHEAAARGAVVLGICGGYQLLGRSYALGREEIDGVGLLDVHTVRGDNGPDRRSRSGLGSRPGFQASLGFGSSPGFGSRPGFRSRLRSKSSGSAPARLIGNVAIEVCMEHRLGGSAQGKHVLAGFENHGGRTYLGADARPLGRVIKGYGNDGRSGWEGARASAGAAGAPSTVIGTYMHGPLLPKNTWFADWLIATALGLNTSELAALDDELERQAHLSARAAAGV